ncbi:diffusible signal factor-reguated Ax21 faimly protein [Thermomonas sp.]|uniref:diffusible signal factor-reguated Ax21 faimly protein n=1 Tax=Thermomonas sp. TaxID=1971895 RepID=UPI001E0FD767|nr:diffusible signal factor-reguated Ax21 faimly protein [Thermomonas sp.]MBZ0086766.1 porin [Thermomonas sp.]HRO63343.1 diffusible signal factor-reguated Ax21 family protein [Thermomonas sp.]
MKRLALAIALSCAAAVPFTAAAADGISYNHVQGGYVATNSNGPDADGWGLGASVAVHPNVHLFANYARQDIKHTAFDFDQWRVGGGYNTQIGSNTDFVANVAYERVSAGGGVNADGYSIEGGVRSALAPRFEGYAMVGYLDGNHLKGEPYGRLGATAKFSPNWGVNADVRIINGGTTEWSVGPRYTW